MLKIAHFSDIHFSKITFNPKKLLSKRAIGVLNLILVRKKQYKENQLFLLHNLFKNLNINNLIVSGDITSTSLEVEFSIAKKFFEKFENIEKHIVPGNHDKYTKTAHKENRFYKFFEYSEDIFSNLLKNDKIEVKILNDKWYYIGLDTCLNTSLFACSGLFSIEIENKLKNILEKIPKDKNIILSNHYPVFNNGNKSKILLRKEVLEEIIKNNKNIKVILHGHTHKRSVEKFSENGYMISSGCVSHKKNGSFNILEILNDECKISTYIFLKGNWEKFSEKNINL